MRGYLVQYEKKKSLFFDKNPGDNFSDICSALVPCSILARMIASPNYLVFSACLVTDIEKYSNESEEAIEIIFENV